MFINVTSEDQSSIYGARAIAIPGLFEFLVTVKTITIFSGEMKCMMVAHEEYGQLPWHEIIQPIVSIVRSGVYVTETNVEALQDHPEKMIGYNEERFHKK